MNTLIGIAIMLACMLTLYVLGYITIRIVEPSNKRPQIVEIALGIMICGIAVGGLGITLKLAAEVGRMAVQYLK